MTLQNRVLPTGEIVAIPARGLFTGNRGIIHRPDGTLGTSRWSHPHWLVCTLTHPRGVYHGPMPDRGWSALFFLDEAVALTAGHRPCHYCRREAYLRWIAAWTEAYGAKPDRMAMDRDLHKARVTRARAQVRHEARMEDLPDGSFVLLDGAAYLVQGSSLRRYTPDGYDRVIARETGPVTVLTPRPTVAVLAAGYQPLHHPSAAR